MELERGAHGIRGRGLMPVSKNHEIWFRRILWGYFPIHWKGLTTLLIGILIIVPALWAGSALSDNHPGLSAGGYLLAVAVLLALFIIAVRHSSP
jgi:hypothetical protein